MSTSTLEHPGQLLDIGDARRALEVATDLADTVRQGIQGLSALLLAELERLGVNLDPQAAGRGYRRSQDGHGSGTVLAIIESHYWLDRAQAIAPHLHSALLTAGLALGAQPEHHSAGGSCTGANPSC